MKFVVHYGRNFLHGKETGRQMVDRLLSEKGENEYNKNIISVPDNKEAGLNVCPGFAVDYVADIRHPNVK